MALNPRFFLPKRYWENRNSLYKTKKELLKIRKDFEKEECVICLLSIFHDENENENFDQSVKISTDHNNKKIDTNEKLLKEEEINSVDITKANQSSDIEMSVLDNTIPIKLKDDMLSTSKVDYANISEKVAKRN